MDAYRHSYQLANESRDMSHITCHFLLFSSLLFSSLFFLIFMNIYIYIYMWVSLSIFVFGGELWTTPKDGFIWIIIYQTPLVHSFASLWLKSYSSFRPQVVVSTHEAKIQNNTNLVRLNMSDSNHVTTMYINMHFSLYTLGSISF